MVDHPPFTLAPRPDGGRELRVPQNAEHAPAVLALDDDTSRAFGIAVADVLTSLDAGIKRLPIRMEIDGRVVTIDGTPGAGLRVIVKA